MNAVDYDVIVVGAGGSGLAAACSAAQQGGRVLVLEKQPQPGGTTGIAVGSFTAAATSLQRQADIEDDASLHAEDAGLFAPPEIERRNDDALRAFFLSEAAATFEWLRGMGLSFVGPSPEPPNRVPRMHNVVPGAKAYIATLQLELLRRGGKLVCGAPVTRLDVDQGRVIGVTAEIAGETTTVRARRGVVLAAGDYAGNAAMIARFKGDAFQQIEGINPFAGGDGHTLAADAGAQLVNMDVTYGPELRFVPPRRKRFWRTAGDARREPFQQWLPARGWPARAMGWVASRLPAFVTRAMIKRLLVTWQHPENGLFDDGAILLNRAGERFVDETGWPDREIGVAAQPDKRAWLLLDERLVRRYSAWPHFVSTAPDIAYAYVKDYQRLRPDVTITGLSLPDVARRAGLPVDATQRSVEQFNRYVDGQQADAQGRHGDKHPLAGSLWVLLGPVRAHFTTTEGGARIDRQLQVLDASGAPIPGLYAVGQNGLGGMILFGHGLHIAWALTSGRLAGQVLMQTRDPIPPRGP